VLPFVVAGACSKSSTDEATSDELDDVAQAFGGTTATGSGGGEVGSMSDSIMLATGTTPSGLSVGGSGQITGTHGGLTYSYSLTCANAAGQALNPCDSTTDRAEVMVSWSGTLSLPNLNASVDRTGDWTFTGLQSTAPVLNGQGTFTFDIMVSSVFRQNVSASYHLDYAANYNAVTFNAAHHAVGGSVHYHISAEHMVTNGSS